MRRRGPFASRSTECLDDRDGLRSSEESLRRVVRIKGNSPREVEGPCRFGRTHTAGDQMDPLGPSSASIRVFRGGSFYHDAVSLRAANRSAATPSAADFYLGLRCIRSYP